MDASKGLKVVETLLDKALNANDAAQAAGYSQSACNVANTLRVLAEIDRGSPQGGHAD
jgi:hypothetical protein